MTYHEIDNAIRDALITLDTHRGIASLHNYYVGFSRPDQNDIISEIQRGDCTVDQAADTIQTWYDDTPDEYAD